jgi:hypothetical protein
VSGKSAVKKATRTVWLYVGGDWDLVDEYNRLEAAAANPTSLAGSDRTRLDELGTQIAADTMAFKFVGLGSRSLQKLTDRHPAREGKVDLLGRPENFNEDTATDELIRKCLVEPDLSDAALTELLEEDLTDGQFQKLVSAVWQLNRRAIDIPLSLTASTNHRTTGDA